MELIKPGINIPFTKYRYIAVVLSSVVNLAVIIMLFAKGPILGVDFAGGTVVQLKFQTTSFYRADSSARSGRLATS